MAIFTTLLGALLAILTTIIVEYARKPNLKIKIDQDNDIEYPDVRPAKHAHFLYLKLTNENLPKAFRWMQRSPALQVHGFITFHHLNGQKIFKDSMEIRWSRAPEPVATRGVIIDDDDKPKPLFIFDFLRIMLEQRRDIYPGESEPFDVATRFEEEKECYGWNNETYFIQEGNWRNPNRKLDSGSYLVNVEIVSAGEKCTGLFRLINEGTRKDFRLVEAQEGDKVTE
jgi:hypothetical protein